MGALLDELMADETVVRGMIARGSPAMLKALFDARLGVLAGQFKKRLGRDLTTLERGVLVARLQRLGADRLSDVVLDTQGEALALWLADPDAR